MISYRTTGELRETIEQILHAPTSASAEEFHELAKVYNDLIIDLNQRTAMCNRLLDQGLRSEAMHVARIDPDLLDSITVMDLGPKLQEWTALCAANDAPSPPPANWGLASHLHEAWEVEQRIEPQLRAFREAMLQHADLPTRLKLLRDIKAVDPGNPTVEDMIMEHEAERLREVAADIQSASREHDLAKIHSIDAELRSADWVNPPAISLIDQAAAALKNERERHTQNEYRKLSAKLIAALKEKDESRASTLELRWNDVVKRSKIEPRREWLKATQPVFDWLNQLREAAALQASHEIACQTLTRLLDEQASNEDLERQYFVVQQSRLPIPELLQQRYRDRSHEHGRATTSRRRSRVAIAVVSLLGLAAITIYTIDYTSKLTDKRAFENNLRSAVEAGDYETIRTLMADGADYTEILNSELGSTARNFVSAQDQKRNEFIAAYEVASKKEDAELASMNLDQLHKLAITDADRRKVESLQTRGNEWKVRQDARMMAELDAAIRQARTSISSLERGWDNVDALDLIRTATNDLKAADDLLVRIEPDATAAEITKKTEDIADCRKRLKSTINKFEQQTALMTARRTLDEAITNSGSTAPERLDKIQAFLAQGHAHPHEDELRRSIEQMESLEAIQAWADLHPDLDLNKPTVSYQLDKIIELREAKWPQAGEVAKLARYLTANELMSMRECQQELSSILAHALNEDREWMHKNLQQVLTNDGIVYTVSNELLPKNAGTWYLNGHVKSGSDVHREGGNGGHIIPANAAQGLEPLTIQPNVIRQWKEDMDKKALLDWPEGKPQFWSLTLMNSLATTPHMNPTIRALLYQQIAVWHVENHWYMPREIERLAEIDIVNELKHWTSPTWQPLRNQPQRDRDLLKKETIKSLHDELQKQAKEIANSKPETHRCLGMVWFDGDTKFIAFFNPDQTHDSLLMLSDGMRNFTPLTASELDDAEVGTLVYTTP